MQTTFTDTAAANLANNPFALIMEPKAVLRAMYKSPELRGLNHKTYRPLDKPWISVTVKNGAAKSAQITATAEH